MNDLYLCHYGVKDQKKGFRRWQNEDGSLTEEGRIHYGYGPERKKSGIAPNTKSRIKQGSKLGLKVGTGLGVLNAGLTLGSYASIAAAAGATLNPIGAAAVGATYLATYAASGYLHGAFYGGVIGAVETRKGQKYIEEYDSKLKNTKLKDLKK